ncbi:MAP kinase [Mycena rebaudengoi]|nr:MAP kinase [Mycena rebaudengoi]
MSEAGRKPRRVQLFVANPGSGSDSSEDEHRPLYSHTYHYLPPQPQPPPAPLTTSLLPNRAPRYQSSHPSLSSPSSTSSPAAEESTPPPSTPGLSAPSLDDPPAQPDYSYDPSFRKLKAPRVPQPSAPRHLQSPTTPDSYSSSSVTVSDRVLILVTADSERYVNVDISGATNPAFIRECVFTKLNIFDEEDQRHFSIYRTEIGSFAIGEALSDDKLFDLCRELADDKGSLKLLVSHTSARPKPRSRSRNGSVSSASENPPPEISAGYEADLDNHDRDRATIRPNDHPLPFPGTSVNGLAVPSSSSNGRTPTRPTSPLPQSSRSSSPLPPARAAAPLMDKYGQLIPPPPPPPPLSPNRASFAVSDDNSLTPPGTQLHARVASDASAAAAEREQRTRAGIGGIGRTYSGRTRTETSQGRDRRRVKTAPHQSDVEDSPGQSADSWVMVNSGSHDSEHPLTPAEARHSPSSAARAAARQQLSPNSRYKPTSPYTGRPLAIPAAPRNPPPSIPATSPESRPPSRPAGHPGPEKSDQRPMPTSSATWSRLTKGTKSMDNLRGVFNNHPSNLTPGGVIRANGIQNPSILSAGTPTSLGAAKSYDARHVRPLPIQGGSSHSTSLDFGPPRSHTSTLMSPNNDPYPRPQSALGDTMTSPNQRYQRQFATSGFGTTLEGDYARSPRAPSPPHQYASSTLPYRASRDRASEVRNGSDPSPVSPRSPRYISRERRPGSSSSSHGTNDAPALDTGSDVSLPDWAKQFANANSEASTLMPETSTYIPSTSDSRTFISTTSESDSDQEETGTGISGMWMIRPTAERPKSILRPALTVQTAQTQNGVHPPVSGGGPPSHHPTFALSSESASTSTPQRPSSPPPPRKRVSTFTVEDSTWARPPAEDVYERLEEFFPEHDLDKPVIEASSGGTSPTNTDQPAPPVAAPTARVKGKKSIRLVAQERKKYIDRTSRVGDGMTNIQRKRSTKLWGSRVEEVDTSSQPESPSTSEGPTTFKWVRGELIGRGTYGRVYLALNATTGEMIAVKQVEIPRTASDKNDSRQVTVVQALKFESETLKVLDHPNIVQYLGFEETPANLSMKVTKSFTSQILAGLEYLHSKGILHRDLKSDNILVEMTGVCKISDFGISKRTDDHNDAHTAMQGTVFWMAPEVINTQKKGYNFKIDIWSIGCVVLEMWAGTRPWLGDEMVAVMFKLFQSKLPPPVPDGLVLTPLADDFRLKCFAINPEERPPAAELRKHPYLTLAPGWMFNGFTE